MKKFNRFVMTAAVAAAVLGSALPALTGCADKPVLPPDDTTPGGDIVDVPDKPDIPGVPDIDLPSVNDPVVRGVYSENYYIPSASDAKTARRWREGFVSGNGENGVITSGAPYCDTFIFQHMAFTMPNGQNHDTPENIYDELAVARERILNKTIATTGFTKRTRQYYYGFHPGHQLKLASEEFPIDDYVRWCDYTSAEAGVTYYNRYGEWERRTFTSRADNVTITYIAKSSTDSKVDITLSIDNVSDLVGFNGTPPGNSPSNRKDMQYKKLVGEDGAYLAQAAHYPDNVKGESAQKYKTAGYAGLTQIVTVGGDKETVELGGTKDTQNVGEYTNPAVKITGADAVYLITQSDKTFDMGAMSEFAGADGYEIVDELYAATNAVAQKYTDADGFDYGAALLEHMKLHKPEFERVTLDLGASEADRALSNEALIKKQKSADTKLLPAFVERSYYAGRYAQICCSGYSTARLGGMWTGEWDSPWGGMYTVDTNVNLQVSSMNTGNLEFYIDGYLSFILRLVDDWMTNAENIYGMHDAIQSSHNTDGDSALIIQTDQAYPFQYWNAGASWLLLPIYEYWQCYGNTQIPIADLKDVNLKEIQRVLGQKDGGLSDAELESMMSRGYMDLEKDILLPLLTKQSNFWEQLCTPEYYMGTDNVPHYAAGKTSLAAGERYLIIPSTSPENNPSGTDYNKGKLAMNATMDISAARNGLEMTIELEKAVNGETGNGQIEKWNKLIADLPEYQYTSGGAIKEWATYPKSSFNYEENNKHRHLSHLYCTWPLYETQNDKAMYDAASQALQDRKNGGLLSDSVTEGHGWVFSAHIAARLGDGETVYGNMRKLARSNNYYESMMTDHNTDRSATSYCTDTLIGQLGVVNESLVFSNTGEIKVLPALVDGWEKGAVSGIRARTRAVVDSLSWDISGGKISVTVTSDIDQTLTLSCGRSGFANVKVDGCESTVDGGVATLELKAGKTVTVDFGRAAQKSKAASNMLYAPSERKKHE